MTERNDEHCCFICEQPFKAGEMVLQDVTEGLGHRACFGDGREGYVHLDTGNPLVGDDPLPTGFPYDPAEFADPAPTERKASSERVSEEKLAEVRGWCAERKAQKPWYGEGEDSPKMLTTCDFLISLIDELLALRSSVKTVGVKKLEWDECAVGYRARKPFGSAYYVQKLPFGKWDWNGLRCASADEAKAAAQADYDQRILSAIEAPAAASEVTDAMVEAAHEAIERSFMTVSWEFGPPSSLARSILTAALKGDR